MNARNGHLASPQVGEMLKRLSCFEAILKQHGVSKEESSIIHTPAIHKIFHLWVVEQRGNFNNVLTRSLQAEDWQPLGMGQRVSLHRWLISSNASRRRSRSSYPSYNQAPSCTGI